MSLLNNIIVTITEWIPTSVLIGLFVLLLVIAKKFLFQHAHHKNSNSILMRQLFFIGLVAISIIAIIVSLPIDEKMRAQLLSLLGIFITAAVALSSTTFLGNLMAGFMLRSINSFYPGDFIEVGDFFGRVSEYGFLHTEIQTEDSNLLTLPNLFLVTTPHKVYRYSGTIISAEVSLGYDIQKERIIDKLNEAALSIGLTSTFVHIKNLGDFSITYKVSGFLEDTKTIVTARSKLRLAMVTKLHEADIEIVSPTFMNQRVFDINKKFLAKSFIKRAEDTDEQFVEELLFDKAEKLENIEELKDKKAGFQDNIKNLKKDASEEKDKDKKLQIEEKIARYEKAIEKLDRIIDSRIEKLEEDD
ncbi:MAG: mechanosensitive ion channel [Bdellovibrionales bacterium]|nr:mechanosensitive ion channel [Bdellovibrionales bacterium]